MWGTTGDAIKLSGFDSTNPYGPHAVEFYQFADGQTLSYKQMIDKGFDIYATPGNDSLVGTAATDRIYGDSNNDTFAGGGGNDTFYGGSGNNTYIYPGTGVFTINDIATADKGNTLIFGGNIVPADISRRLTFEGNTLTISLDDNGDEVNLTGFDPNKRGHMVLTLLTMSSSRRHCYELRSTRAEHLHSARICTR